MAAIEDDMSQAVSRRIYWPAPADDLQQQDTECEDIGLLINDPCMKYSGARYLLSRIQMAGLSADVQFSNFRKMRQKIYRMCLLWG